MCAGATKGAHTKTYKGTKKKNNIFYIKTNQRFSVTSSVTIFGKVNSKQIKPHGKKVGLD